MSEPDIVDTDSPGAGWDFHIYLAADWNDPLPQLLDADEEPLDLTGYDLEIYVRPTRGHPTLLLFVSTADAEFDFDDITLGLTSINVPMADIQTAFEEPGTWQWFMRMTDGAAYEWIASGDFYVHAADDSIPP